jgi:hypothetical protein
MAVRRTLAVCSVFLAAVALAGCSDPYAGRQEITGAVTLAGQPLKAGTITFFPLDGQGTQSGSGIADGTYKVPRQTGLKPGKYRIEITAGDGKTSVTNPEEAGGPGGSRNIVSVDMVPEDWNTKSKREITVTSAGPNKFDFEIPNVNPRARRR